MATLASSLRGIVPSNRISIDLWRLLMRSLLLLSALLANLCLLGLTGDTRADDPPSHKVYGEWRIRIKPDKGAEYNDLIRAKGLTLFRQAGGRMVGWWATLIGDLYEHVTIWEYDNMAAFEKAVGFLGKSQKFAEFVALRDPLLAGEQSRFLRLSAGSEPPQLDETARFVIHEIQRVPLENAKKYMDFMEKTGLPLLKKHGFHPVGPFAVDVGQWREMTLLFRFESLAERERLIDEIGRHADGETYIRA